MADTPQSSFEFSRPEPDSDQNRPMPETQRPRSSLMRLPRRVSFVAQTPASEPEQAQETKGSTLVPSQNGDKDLYADSQRLVEPSLADMPTRQEPAISLADMPTRRVRAVSLAGLPVTPPLALVEPLAERLREPVERYMQWLQRNNTLRTPREKFQLYRESSMQIQKVGRREVRTFAPFQADWSALRVITPPQVLLLMLLLLCWGVGFFFLRLTMITVSLGLVTVLYILGFITSSLLAASSLGKDSGEKIDEEIILALDKQGATWPMYTILCPLFKSPDAGHPRHANGSLCISPSLAGGALLLTECDGDGRAGLFWAGSAGASGFPAA